MAKLYCDLIGKGLKTLADVPQRWRAETAAIMDAEAPHE